MSVATLAPDAAHPAEELYVTRWPNRHRELLALATDEDMGRVRREFATQVRADIRAKAKR